MNILLHWGLNKSIFPLLFCHKNNYVSIILSPNDKKHYP